MPHETSVQPKLGDLLARFLSKQASAHVDGLAHFDATAEVQPFEAGPVQPIDAKLAWDEALAALRYFHSSQTHTRGQETWQAPPHWPNLVAAHEPVLALVFCVGNFPQLVRNFHMILETANLDDWKPTSPRPVSAPALEEWAKEVALKKQFPQALLTLGALRLAKQLPAATALVRSLDAAVPQEWRGAWDNEKAALLWQRGQTREARDLWHRLEPTVPVLFNRGMSDLFLGNAAAARPSLEKVVQQLPESSAWHHLAKLYLLLGEK
jgi:tetratricopeptide (TPR) repeat protein